MRVERQKTAMSSIQRVSPTMLKYLFILVLICCPFYKALGGKNSWTMCFQDKPATRQRPEDRRAAREAREIERKNQEKQRR